VSWIDAFQDLLNSDMPEIKVVLSDVYQPEHLNKGEYIRYYITDESEADKFANGVTKNYSISLYYYFDETRYRKEKIHDRMWDRATDLRTVLESNYNYSSGTYYWHNLSIDSVQYFMNASDFGLEEEGFETIKAVVFEITLTRNENIS